jgi:hypothetical protein
MNWIWVPAHGGIVLSSTMSNLAQGNVHKGLFPVEQSTQGRELTTRLYLMLKLSRSGELHPVSARIHGVVALAVYVFWSCNDVTHFRQWYKAELHFERRFPYSVVPKDEGLKSWNCARPDPCVWLTPRDLNLNYILCTTRRWRARSELMYSVNRSSTCSLVVSDLDCVITGEDNNKLGSCTGAGRLFVCCY